MSGVLSDFVLLVSAKIYYCETNEWSFYDTSNKQTCKLSKITQTRVKSPT